MGIKWYNIGHKMYKFIQYKFINERKSFIIVYPSMTIKEDYDKENDDKEDDKKEYTLKKMIE